MDDLTAERLAANEARFREINERLRQELTDLLERDERIAFVCECSNQACRAAVELTIDQYADVRRSDQRFAVCPGHEQPEIEHVVGHYEGVSVVEKHRAQDVTATGQ